MRFLLTLLSVFALTSPLISVSATGAVGDACCDDNTCTTQQLCNNGLKCCYFRPLWMQDLGGTCYDPKVSTCASCPVYNPNHPQTEVCPLSAPTCCGGCIDNTKQCCHIPLSYDFFQCGAGQTCCGIENGKHLCCNSDQSCVNDVCIPKTGPCQGGQIACGAACYDSSQYVCVDPLTGLLCPKDSPLLCGDACYNQAQYTCVGGSLVPVQSGGGSTQGPTQGPTSGPTSSTPAPGCVIPGDLKCGTRCYSPLQQACADPSTSFLCPIAFPLLCGANACYNQTQYSCSNGQLVPVTSGGGSTQGPTSGSTPAPGCVLPGDLKCGTRCYSPVTHVCADPTTSFLCPIAFPSLCGANACYNQAQYTCVNGQLVPK